MLCDCGHKAERGILTTRGLLCFECKAAVVCPVKRVQSQSDRLDNESMELRQAKKCLRKKLPLEWSEEKLDALARRLVHRQKYKGD